MVACLFVFALLGFFMQVLKEDLKPTKEYDGRKDHALINYDLYKLKISSKEFERRYNNGYYTIKEPVKHTIK